MPLAYSVKRLIPLTAVILWILSLPWVVSNAGGSNDYADPFTTKPGTVTSPPRSTIKTSISHHSVQITMEDAIVLALKNNRSLRIERLNPSIQQTFEDEVRAAFDPTFNGEADFSREKEQERAKNSPAVSDNTSNESNLAVGVSQFFSTGTDVNVDLSTKRDWSDDYRDQHASRVGLSVTQALLRGRGTDVNLADLRQAQLDTRASQYELHGFVEALVSQVKQAYWDYALAQRRIEIFQESLNLADQQLRETEEMIKVGKLAETEVTAAQAEIALRRRDLIDARSSLETTRLRLLRLLNLPGTEPLKLEVTLLSYPEIPKVKLDPVEAHVESALRLRSDLNQAQLGIQRNELDIVKTKNGLLPKMDFFITLGKTGYADSFSNSLSHVTEDYYDISSGIRFEYPFRNRESEARYRRSLIRRDQADNAMENLAQLVELDVRSAFIEVERAQEQISATAVSRGLQEEKLRIETEKFRVGRSTMFLVAQAQRDLVFSRIAEVEAVINYLKALIDFYRLEGTLLTRHNISTFNG
jgi:outer membrane protein